MGNTIKTKDKQHKAKKHEKKWENTDNLLIW